MDEQENSKRASRAYRHRSRKKKERVARRNAFEETERDKEKDTDAEGKDEDADTEVNDSTCGIKGPFKDRRSVKDVANEHFKNVQSLEEKLVFCTARPDLEDPFGHLSLKQGTRIAKKLRGFLQHIRPSKQYYKWDGSMALQDVEKATGINADSILVAVNPIYDRDGKRRFLVMEKFFPNGERGTYIAALGGHSLPVISPPGHYQLGIESLSQLEPLVHNTSSKDEIVKSGFLSRQGRTGGINLCSERNSRLFRPSASDTTIIHVRDCLKLGILFFGNFFTDVILCTGSWDDGVWNGKIPLECFHFEKRK